MRARRGAAVPLVGRAHLLAEALDAHAEQGLRLVTFHGRQGVGKTRLAEAVAQGLDEPVHVIDLADAEGEAEFLARGLHSIGLSQVGATSHAAVVAHVREHGCTLLMDGCRDTDTAYDQAELLLRQAPGLRLLVTAPTPLDLPAEHVIPVPPLALPAADVTDDEALRASPAVQLFLESAAMSSPEVDLRGGDLHTVAEVCRRLDGLPAALTLAAARLRIMQPAVMLEHMSRLGAWELVGLSLEEEVARTFDLLDESTRAVAVALAVTEGGASSQALASLVEGLPEGEVVSALTLLIDLGLVQADAAHARVALTSSAAALVCRRYAGTEQWRACAVRHTDHYVEQARRFARRPHGATVDPGWLLDHRNRLRALTALREAGERERALRLAVDGMPGFEHRGEPVPGRALLADLLHQTPETTSGACIAAHVWLGRLEAELGDGVRTESAWGHFSRALHLARTRGDLVPHLEVLNAVCENQVLLEEGVQHCEDAVAEALALTEGADLELGRSVFLGWHAANLHRRHRYAQAADAVEQALSIARSWGDLRLLMSFAIVYWQMPREVRRELGAPSLADLLDMAEAQGDVRSKGWVWAVAVHTAIEDGDDLAAVEHSLGMLDLARRTHQRPLARQVVAATCRLLDRYPHPATTVTVAAVLARHAEHLVAHLPPRFVEHLQQAVARATAALGEDLAAEHHDAGLGLDPWAALDRCESVLRALAVRLQPAGLAAVDVQRADEGPLTPRESDVLQALRSGASNKEVARLLGLRPKTVAHHCASIYVKLSVRNRTEAVAEALRQGLLPR